MQSIWHLCFLATAALYDIKVETTLPHLEENLRYAITRTERCLTRNDLGSAFPVLDHPSLAGCKLRERSSDAETIIYALVCDNSSGTTGTATWRLAERVMHGTLEVKLGGKNMTFSQRVTARHIGECPPVG
jgi:hypothetical protein